MDTDDIMEVPDEAFAGKDPLSTQEVRTVSVKQLQSKKAALIKLTDWEKEPTVQDLKKDLLAAQPARDAIVGQINKWAELLEGGKPIPKRRGRSSVRPKLIRRQAEWRYSSLAEPFLSSNKVFQISPRTFEDAKAAMQNELLLNWQFQTKIDTDKLINESVRTMVDEGTLILRVGWNRQTEKENVTVPVYKYIRVYEGTEEEQILIQALQLEKENPKAYSELDPAIRASIDYSRENQVTAWAIQDGVTEQEQEKITANHPTIEIVDYRNIYVDPSCKGHLDKANFIVMSFETSRAELVKDGRYKNLQAVNWSTADVLSDPDHHTEIPDGFNFDDKWRKRIIAYEYWGMADITGTGVLEPIVATWIDNQMIRMERNPYPDQKPPFEFVNYSPKKRSLFGEPDAELLEDNQQIAGAITRGTIDLLGRSANSQQGIQKGLLDVTNRRRWEAGEDYEYNPAGHPGQSIIQHKYPEIPQSALTMLTMQNQEAEGLTGVKAFSGGMSGEAYGDVAAGVRGVLDAASKREMNILRRMANGFKAVGSRIMAMNAVFLSEEEVVRVTNEKFVTIKREDIQGEFDLVVDISTPEMDEKKSQDLSFMLQTLGPTTPLPFTQMILGKIAKLKKLPELAHQIENFQPEPDPLEEKKKELEIAELEHKISKLKSETAKNYAHAEKLQADADATDLDTELEAAGIKHSRDMEKQSEQARGNQDLEVTKAITRPQKDGEGRVDLEEAIGFNQLTKNMSSASNTPQSVLSPQSVLDPYPVSVQ